MPNENAEKPILISEVFGPTIQGEGVLLGAPTVFVRTGGCDFRCNWCVAPDTPILLADWTERAARDIAVGDEIVGMKRRDGVPEAVGRYQVGKVEGVARRETRLLRLSFSDGRETTVAAEHAFAHFKTGRFVRAENLTGEERLRALPLDLPAKDKDEAEHAVCVRGVEEIGCGEVVSIKTSLGTYVANGMLSRNCDTLYAVLPEHKSEWTPMSAPEILVRVLALTGGKPILITLSGGNPALAPLAPLIELGKARGFSFALETQGSVARNWFAKLDYLILSPKPPSSGMETRWKRVAQCIEAARKSGAGENADAAGAQVSLKIVVFDDADYAFARDAATRFPQLPMILQPGTPPATAASTRETFNENIAARVDWLIQCVARDGWHEARIVPQTHVLLWGNKRGV